MSVESDNIVIRHLREFRAHVDSRFDEMDFRFVKGEARLSDVEGLSRKILSDLVAVAGRVEQLEGLGHKTSGDLVAVAGRVDQLEGGLRVVDGLSRETLDEVRGVAHQVGRLETGLRVAERLEAVERKLAALEERGHP
jgi:hypothetical protein